MELKSKHAETLNENLILIRSNLNRYPKQELIKLIYDRIFLYEYKKEQNIWIKKADPTQEMQCVDSITKFLELENDPQIRDIMFELLFDDIHQISTKHILQMVLSYSISLEAQKTLESISKWIIINIGNELIQNIFNQLVRDHFLLVDEREPQPAQNLINLASKNPLFASLLMSIVLDMFANNLISNHDRCLTKLFNLFEIWINSNPMLPLLAYKANLTHAGSYMLNPLPGLLYVTVVYPIRTALEFFYLDKKSNRRNSSILDEKSIEKQFEICNLKLKNLDDELIGKVHLISLKLVKNVANVLETAANKTCLPNDPSSSLSSSSSLSGSSFKLINLKNLEQLSKRFEDLNRFVDSNDKKLKLIKTNEYSSSLSNEILYLKRVNDCLISLKEECLDRLAQILELAWRYGFISCTKQDAKLIFNNSNNYQFDSDQSNKNSSLLNIVLNG